MKIERIILVFKKDEDDLKKEIVVQNLTLSVIKELFVAKEGDTAFYDIYRIEESQYDKLVAYVPELKQYSCDQYEMYLEAVSVE